MLDRILGATFKNFSTFFLLVAVVTVPLHLAYAFVFDDVIAARDLHAYIVNFPLTRQVGGVGRVQLRNASFGFYVITLVEIALIPVALRAVRQILATDAARGVPTVWGAWSGAFARSSNGSEQAGRVGLLGLAVCTVVAVAIGWLVQKIGFLVAEPVASSLDWAVVGLTRGVARALAAPFALVALARYFPRGFRARGYTGRRKAS
jgi:hypothetical protein